MPVPKPVLCSSFFAGSTTEVEGCVVATLRGCPIGDLLFVVTLELAACREELASCSEDPASFPVKVVNVL